MAGTTANVYVKFKSGKAPKQCRLDVTSIEWDGVRRLGLLLRYRPNAAYHDIALPASRGMKPILVGIEFGGRSRTLITGYLAVNEWARRQRDRVIMVGIVDIDRWVKAAHGWVFMGRADHGVLPEIA